MSAYAGLVSLQQTVAAILDGGGVFNVHNEAQLRSLHGKATFLVDFLQDSSSTRRISAALEANMRDAAHSAENLIQARDNAIALSDARRRRVLTANTVFNFFFFSFVFSNRIPVSFPEAIPEPVVAFALAVLVPALASAALCAVCGAGAYLVLGANNSLDLNDSRAPLARQLRAVLCDLSTVVDRIKAARGDLESASAHAALLSLRKLIDSVIESGVSDNRDRLERLRGDVTFLLGFLSNAYAHMSPAEVKSTEEATKDAVYEAKKVLELQIILGSDRKSLRRLMKLMVLALLSCVSALATARMPFPFQLAAGWVILVILGFGVLALGTSRSEVFAAINNPAQANRDLCLAMDDLSIIVQNVSKFKDACSGNLTSSTASASAALPAALSSCSSSFRRDFGGGNVVGLEHDTREIKERLIQSSSQREVILIVGMGGIGKTTLATQVYNDVDVASYFDIRAWATVSQDYSLRHVLLALLDSAKVLRQQMQNNDDDEEMLALSLYRDLVNRRYLIVIDDVWDTKIWDFLRRYLPENRNGSRIILTSRLRGMDNNSSIGSGRRPHQMKCLDEDQSWRLLREKVFGADCCCPSGLESIGRNIVKGCGGLPLAILVIGGVLSKEEKQSTIWEEVAKNLKLGKIKRQCLVVQVLGLSYKHLPHHLRPCFLYFGVFLGDSEIPFSRLVNLWIAEGFLKPRAAKSLEEEAEDILKDLVDRNLILDRAKGCNGRIRTCGIHDLLRKFCVEIARKENFFHVREGGGEPVSKDWERTHRGTRRVSVRPDAVNGSHGSMSSYYNLRSLLYTATASKLPRSQPHIYLGFVYLRVLDVLVLHFGEFPDQIIKLVCLRYLALHYDGPLPSSMSKLRNLETIVHHHCSLKQYPSLPRVIWWSMPNLRYLYVKPGLYLSGPVRVNPFRWKVPILEHLHTLIGIRNFKWSEDIIARIPNLKKLGISYHASSSVDWAMYKLDSLADLRQLECLKIAIEYYNDGGSAVPPNPPELVFPQKLKKLSLSGRGIPWDSFGSLQNLEVLKLRNEECSDSQRVKVEVEFPKLRFLLLENMGFTSWEPEEDCFPCLELLVVKKYWMLEEIPFENLGYIPTLETIELDDCPYADSIAYYIQQEQREMGTDIKVLIKW